MDISNAALKIASENAQKYRTDIRFLLADVCDPANLVHLPVFDLIVSNPPYVTQSERAVMQSHVFDHEPGLALFVEDEDPLRFYDAIFRMSHEHLKVDGRIVFEINEKFGKEMMELAANHGFRSEVLKDIHEKDRFLFASRHEITIPE
jgi:release factor glutamine methyltransferase